jgi:hypothetical protein
MWLAGDRKKPRGFEPLRSVTNTEYDCPSGIQVRHLGMRSTCRLLVMFPSWFRHAYGLSGGG